jgi:hypothetical protein
MQLNSHKKQLKMGKWSEETSQQRLYKWLKCMHTHTHTHTYKCSISLITGKQKSRKQLDIIRHH